MAKKNKRTEKVKLYIAWGLFITALLATLVAESFIHVHAVTGIDGKSYFYAWFGFIACIIMVLFSKFLGFFLKRPDNYYKEGRDD
jgi:hypothetical protein